MVHNKVDDISIVIIEKSLTKQNNNEHIVDDFTNENTDRHIIYNIVLETIIIMVIFKFGKTYLLNNDM